MGAELEQKIWVLSIEEIELQKEWIKKQMEEIGQENIELLAVTAASVRGNAITPVSGYHVGAALLCQSGRKSAAANLEVQVRPIGIPYAFHAESTSIWRSVIKGEVQTSGRRFIKAVAVSHSGGCGEDWSGPCGICLQDLYEFCNNCLVVIADEKGEITHTTSLMMLMTRPFTPSHLGIE